MRLPKRATLLLSSKGRDSVNLMASSWVSAGKANAVSRAREARAESTKLPAIGGGRSDGDRPTRPSDYARADPCMTTTTIGHMRLLDVALPFASHTPHQQYYPCFGLPFCSLLHSTWKLLRMPSRLLAPGFDSSSYYFTTLAASPP